MIVASRRTPLTQLKAAERLLEFAQKLEKTPQAMTN
jgi:hypothetical protein